MMNKYGFNSIEITDVAILEVKADFQHWYYGYSHYDWIVTYDLWDERSSDEINADIIKSIEEFADRKHIPYDECEIKIEVSFEGKIYTKTFEI